MSSLDFSKYLATLPKVPPRAIVILDPGANATIAAAPEGGFDITAHVSINSSRYCLTVHTTQPRQKILKTIGSGGRVVLSFDTARAASHVDAFGCPFTVYPGDVGP